MLAVTRNESFKGLEVRDKNRGEITFLFEFQSLSVLGCQALSSQEPQGAMPVNSSAIKVNEWLASRLCPFATFTGGVRGNEKTPLYTSIPSP